MKRNKIPYTAIFLLTLFVFNFSAQNLSAYRKRVNSEDFSASQKLVSSDQAPPKSSGPASDNFFESETEDGAEDESFNPDFISGTVPFQDLFHAHFHLSLSQVLPGVRTGKPVAEPLYIVFNSFRI